MSIRLRLTLLYSAILVLTLIALGLGIYAAVSNVTLSAARDALTTETRTVATSLQGHLGPYPGGGAGPAPHEGQPPPQGSSQVQRQQRGPGQGQYAPQPSSQRQNLQQCSNQGGNLGSFIPPPDVTVQNSIQVRCPDGTVVYRSQDLLGAKVTLPLSAAARQSLRPGAITQTIVTLGTQRLLTSTILLSANAGPTGILQVARSLHDMDQLLTTLRQILLAGSAIVTLVAFGAGWWLAGTALRPINRIAQTAQEIGATQDFGRRVAYTGPPDEVGRLAATFNTMLSRLQAAYQAQRRFVADASHELRTPLTSIRGNLGLLQREPPIAEADRVAVIADLVSESERLSRLVGDLLTLARTDTGRPPRQDPVPLSPLVADVIRRLAVLHPGRLIHEDAYFEATARGDRDALTQVLLILLDNALKFTPADGTVTVTSAIQGDRVAIAVRDSGPGISPEALPHIFERFYQGDAARAGMGTGLGLAIAKAMVEAQGGTIAVESWPGRGSTFTVTLPRARAGQGAHS
ncbi:MAG TPA: HAMP domain-containing sensor histidine kinase [Chloroflexota bacterium]|nr:HAMP domain-containing sensor histidine kinase [Chloroflexota bacterium]